MSDVNERVKRDLQKTGSNWDLQKKGLSLYLEISLIQGYLYPISDPNISYEGVFKLKIDSKDESLILLHHICNQIELFHFIFKFSHFSHFLPYLWLHWFLRKVILELLCFNRRLFFPFTLSYLNLLFS